MLEWLAPHEGPNYRVGTDVIIMTEPDDFKYVKVSFKNDSPPLIYFRPTSGRLPVVSLPAPSGFECPERKPLLKLVLTSTIQIIWMRWLQLNLQIKRKKGWCSYLYRHQVETMTTVRVTQTGKHHRGNSDILRKLVRDIIARDYLQVQRPPGSHPGKGQQGHEPRELQHGFRCRLKGMSHVYDSIIAKWLIGMTQL